MNTLASRGLEEPFFQLFCCVVLVFGSCENKVFDLLSVCWVRGSGDYDRKKKDTVVCLAGCAVLSVFGSGGKLAFFCSGGKFWLRPEKKIQSSVGGKLAVFLLWREIFITTEKKDTLRPDKKGTVVCLMGARFWRLRPEKKRYSRLSVGCAVLAITTGKKKKKKKIQSSTFNLY